MGVVSLSYFMVLRRYTVTLTESFVLCLLLNTEGASQNNHQSVSRCLSAEGNKTANIWQVTIFTAYFMVLRQYTVTLTESFVLCLLLNTEGASQNNHQSVSRCLSAEWNKNVNIW